MVINLFRTREGGMNTNKKFTQGYFVYAMLLLYREIALRKYYFLSSLIVFYLLLMVKCESIR